MLTGEKYIRQIKKRVAKTLYSHNLISNGDSVLVGLSGGKDSFCLLESLVEFKRHGKVQFKITATHIKISSIPYEVDEAYLNDFCNKLGVNFIYKRVNADVTNSEKSECFLCSWHRRKNIFQIADECNCNMVAFGHHLDDALETLFMNMIFHGTISSLPIKLDIFEGRIKIIRPLMELKNAELLEYSTYREFPKMKGECPYSNKTQRTAVRNIIDNICKTNKLAKANLFKSMSNIFIDYLPFMQVPFKGRNLHNGTIE